MRTAVAWLPSLLLIYLWLVVGQTDPGAPLESVRFLRWISYPAIGVAVAITWVYVMTVGKLRTTGIEIHLALVMGVLCLSGLVNDTRPSEILLGAAIYLRYPLLFLLLVNVGDYLRGYSAFIRLFVLIAVAVSLEGIANNLVLGLHQDRTYISLGPFAGTSTAGVFLLYLGCLIWSDCLVRRIRAYHLVGVLLILAAAYIASIRATLALVLPMGVFLYLVHQRFIGTRLVIAISLFGVCGTTICAWLLWHSASGDLSIPTQVSPQYRLSYIGAVMDELVNSGALWLGVGPLSMSPASVASEGAFYALFQEEMLSVARGGVNQYVKAFAEMGVIGFAIYWLMLVKVLRVVYRGQRDADFRNHLDRTASLAFVGLWLHFSSIGLLYNDFWRFEASALVFWTIAAHVHVSRRWCDADDGDGRPD